MKRMISILLTAAMIFVLLPASGMTLFAEESAIWDGSVATGFASGTRTEGDPYIIETAEQLAFLASSTNSGKYIKFANDIVLNDTSDWESWDTIPPTNSWTPIEATVPILSAALLTVMGILSMGYISIQPIIN